MPDEDSRNPEYELGCTIFVDEAVVYEEPSFTSREVTRLPGGMMVSGNLMTQPDTGEPWLAFEREGRRVYMPATATYRIHPENARAGDLEIGRETINRWWGVPLDYEPSDLEHIPEKYSIPDDKEYLLRREALEALIAMLDAAEQDGVGIKVISAYRSGQRQKNVYLRAVERDGTSQRYSAPPGHSEHQLGTTVDLVDPEQKELFTQEFAQTPQGRWLEENAHRFAFLRSYTEENESDTGYIPEPWHWRYMGKHYPGKGS